MADDTVPMTPVCQLSLFVNVVVHDWNILDVKAISLDRPISQTLHPDKHRIP